MAKTKRAVPEGIVRISNRVTNTISLIQNTDYNREFDYETSEIMYDLRRLVGLAASEYDFNIADVNKYESDYKPSTEELKMILRDTVGFLEIISDNDYFQDLTLFPSMQNVLVDIAIGLRLISVKLI